MASKKKTVKNSDNLVLNIKELIEDLKKKKTAEFFKEPVDEIKHGATGYYEVIKNPMDLSTILAKLKNAKYVKPNEVLEDLRLICKNCREYNISPANPVRKKCDQFEELFLKKWQDNAEALESAGINIDDAFFDYSRVELSILNEVKLTKEQKALQNDQYVQKLNSQSDFNPSNLSAYSITRNPSQDSRQSKTKSIPPGPYQSSRDPLSFPSAIPPTQTFSASTPYDPTAIKPQRPQQVPRNPNPTYPSSHSQPPQQANNIGYPQSYPSQTDYQQSPMPQFRPSYQPKNSQPLGVTSFDRPNISDKSASKSVSNKIDLGQLGLHLPPSSFDTSHNNNFPAKDAYYNPAIDINYDYLENKNPSDANSRTSQNIDLPSFVNGNMTDNNNKIDIEQPLNDQDWDEFNSKYSQPTKDNVPPVKSASSIQPSINTANYFPEAPVFPDQGAQGPKEPMIPENDWMNDKQSPPFYEAKAPSEPMYFPEFDSKGKTEYTSEPIKDREVDKTPKEDIYQNYDKFQSSYNGSNQPSSGGVTESIKRKSDPLKGSSDSSKELNPEKAKSNSQTGSVGSIHRSEPAIKATVPSIKTSEPSIKTTQPSIKTKDESLNKKREGDTSSITRDPKKEPTESNPSGSNTKKSEINWESTKESNLKNDIGSRKGELEIVKRGDLPSKPSDSKTLNKSYRPEEANKSANSSRSDSAQKSEKYNSQERIPKTSFDTKNPNLNKEKPTSSADKPRLEKTVSNSQFPAISSATNKSPEKRDKMRIEGSSNTSDKESKDRNLVNPFSKNRPDNEGDRSLIKSKLQPISSEKTNDQSKSNFKRAHAFDDNKNKEAEEKKPLVDQEDDTLNDLIADIVNLHNESGGKTMSAFDEIRATKQGIESENEIKGEESLRVENTDKTEGTREVKTPKESSRKDKDRDRNYFLSRSGGDRERDRDKDKDKERERERERDRDREKERDRDKEKDRDREREREKDRDRERDDKSSKSSQHDDSKKKQASLKVRTKGEDETGESIYQPVEKEIVVSSKIKFDIPTLKKDYEAFARLKVPKYIKKFQRHVRKLGSFFRDLEIKDETIVKLKEEVEHLNLTDKSLNYSRVLLYLFDVLVFCKYNHEMNKVKYSKKVIRRMINVIKKAFFYMKDVIKLSYMKFTEEEVEAFDKNARDYRQMIHQQVKQFRGQKNQPPPPVIHSYDTGILTGSMPSKITIIQPSLDQEPKAVTKTMPHFSHKRDTGMKVKILAPQGKKLGKVEGVQPKEETEEDIIKKEMGKYLSEIRGEYESKQHHEKLEKNISTSWKTIDEETVAKSLIEKEAEKSKDIKLDPVAAAPTQNDMDIESDNIFPTTSSASLFSFSLSDKRKKEGASATSKAERRPSPKRPAVFRNSEDTDQKYQPKPLWKPDISLFQKEKALDIYNINYNPGLLNIEGTLRIDISNYPMNMSATFDHKLSFILFSNKLDDMSKISLRKRGIDIQESPMTTSDLYFSKLAVMKVEIRQNKDRSGNIYEGNKQNYIDLSLKNKMSVEAFDKIEHMAEEKIKNEIRIKDYDALLALPRIKEIMQNNDFLDKILDKLMKGRWRFQENLALFYSYDSREDPRSQSLVWSINIILLIEDMASFKFSINEKKIL